MALVLNDLWQRKAVRDRRAKLPMLKKPTTYLMVTQTSLGLSVLTCKTEKEDWEVKFSSSTPQF